MEIQTPYRHKPVWGFFVLDNAGNRDAVLPVQFPELILVESELPIVKNAGRTIQDAGKITEAPFTAISGAVTGDSEKVLESGRQLGEGILETAGLGGLVDNWVKAPWGGIKIPERFNKEIEAAAEETSKWDPETQADMQNYGYKHWHMLSNAYNAAHHGLIESLLFPLIGGIGHEVDPVGISQEWERQGFWSWLVDTPGDLFANIMGQTGGLLLPENSLSPYVIFWGGIIPGPKDPAIKDENK